MSTREALQAFKGKFGESAFLEAFGSEEDYLASIRNEPTITGTAPKLWHLGPRSYAAKSQHAQEIQATAAQRTGAAILAPSAGVVALDDDDDARRRAHLVLVPSSAKPDPDLNYWEGVVDSQISPYEDLRDGGNWSSDAAPPGWGELIKSPSGRKHPDRPSNFYRGPLARGVTHQYFMTKDACGTDATMLEHWERAAFYARRLSAILKKERKAFEDMRDEWEAMGNGGSGRPRRGPRRSHDPKDDYAALTRTKTEEMIKNEPTKWYKHHFRALRSHLKGKEALLEAIADHVGVPRCVLTALDQDERAYVISPVIKVDLPGLGPNLVMGNWDHEALRWKDDQRAIYLLGLRGLIWDALNRALAGYEWYLARAAEREHLEAYLKSCLCCDRSFGDKFVLEIEIEDEKKYWGMKTKERQEMDMKSIKRRLLKGAILGATEGRADAAWNSST